MVRLLTLKEASKVLKVSSDKLYRIVKSDSTFPATKIGGTFRVDEDLLDQWVKDKFAANSHYKIE